jgi:hypothetical protein
VSERSFSSRHYVSWDYDPNSTTTSSREWICPDLLSIRDIGAADGWRGYVVRGFFRVLKWVTGV